MVADQLKENGFEVIIPDGAERILNGEMTLEEFMNKVNKGEGTKAKIEHDVIRTYFKKISDSDAILVLNYKKKEIENYIGGNTFLEIGFAHVLNKKIYLLNPIPEMHYKDELVAMQPIVINGDLGKIIL
jgi:nucleoside 2-deoxyribosyltransferase